MNVTGRSANVHICGRSTFMNWQPRRQRQHLRLADFYGLVMPTAAQIASYSNPVAPPQHDHTAQLDAWADHVARGYIVR